ncbi:unnamed protein product [Chrysoparadoxa australica]
MQDWDGWGSQSVRNVLDALSAARRVSLSHFIFALGIRHVGSHTANLVAAQFKSAEEWWGAASGTAQASVVAQLEGIPGVGPVAIASIKSFAKDPRNRAEVEALLSELLITATDGAASPAPIDAEELPPQAVGAMAGKTVVFTGVLSSLSRSQAQELAERAGARVTGAISGKTDLVVVGRKPGRTKLDKIKELGLEAVSEESWRRMCGM